MDLSINITPQKKAVNDLELSPRTIVSLDLSPRNSQDTTKYFGSSTKTARTNSIDSLWSLEIYNLKTASSTFEVTISLRNIKGLLDGIDKSDRLKFCKHDIITSFKMVKKKKRVWTSSLYSELADIISTYFNENQFKSLPSILIQEIFQYLHLSDFSHVPVVCQDFRSLSSADEVWNAFYHHKFLRNNPGSEPVSVTGYMNMFRNRFQDPELGDRVEVSWHGKFRLESSDVYHGLAWWVGVVVDKHTSQGKYKIHYPGWDSRWDEWVQKSRLRWKVERNTIETINVKDIVELWCCGSSVPGAWLESYVRKIDHNGRYCVGEVLSSGNLWVERDRIRLVRSASTSSNALATASTMALSAVIGRGIMERFVLQQPQSQRANRRRSSTSSAGESMEDEDERSSCSIM